VASTNYEYRISKFDSKYRNSEGIYTKDEWTSIGDVGKMYDGKTFTMSEYLRVENQYLAFINKICVMDNIRDAQITGLEDYKHVCTFYDGETLTRMDDILKVAKSCLREEYWCRLTMTSNFVHFGYDYYLYICCSLNYNAMVNLAREHGLFVEEMESPYKECEDS
jgi:hypothetical protein